MSGQRAVPASIKRRVLVEAGHRCAIPTCRYIKTQIHHIIPWAQRQEHKYPNLIALCPNCHERADRGEIDRKSLRLYKANLRFAHDKFSQLEIDILFEVNALQPGESIPWLPFMRLLIKRILDAEYIKLSQRTTGGTAINNVLFSPDELSITDQGRKFIQDIGSELIDVTL